VLTLVVLRHARAGERATWTGLDRARPLNDEGFQQSLALVERLERIPIDQVLTSPFVRCQHTVAPLAAVRRLAVIEQLWLAEATTRTDIRRGLSTIDCDTLLCTHGDNVGVILDEIGADVEVPARFELEKAAAFVFRFEHGDVVDVVHLPAPIVRIGFDSVRSMASRLGGVGRLDESLATG
jgi:phosphohistidine phosphatase SixA